MRIGTRSSRMALAQTEEIVRQLAALDGGVAGEIVRFTPSGDRDVVSKLDRHGGKGGAFVGEIRDAMRDGALEAAMHSLKDVPGDEETPGLVLGAYLKREAVEDALVLRPDQSLEAFERDGGAGRRIGTNSVRRAAFLKRLYPAADVIHFRGAADTRLRKLDNQEPQKLPDGGATDPADALVMAASGLSRIGFGDRIAKTFDIEDMLPAVGQGIVVVECAANDWTTQAHLAKIDDPQSRARALAERELLWVLNGHCNSPIAGHATIDGDAMTLRACVLSLDGEKVIEETQTADAARPRELGRAVALALLGRGADALIEAARP